MQRFALWRSRHYPAWFVADTTDVFAVSLRTFAVSLLAYAVSQSKAVTGVIVSIESVGTLVLTPIGGTLADRQDRRRMTLAANAAGFLLCLLLGGLVATNRLGAITLAVICLLFSLVVGLLGPANDAMLKSLIPTSLFAKAQAVRESREAVVGLTGSAVSGFLYKISRCVPIFSAAVLYALGFVATLTLPSSARRRGAGADMDMSEADGQKADGETQTVEEGKSAASAHTDADALEPTPNPGFWRELGEGWRWALSKKRFAAAIALGALVNISFVAAQTGAQIQFVAEGINPVKIGLLDTGMGAVSLVGALLANYVTEKVPTGTILWVSLAWVGCCFVPLIFTSSYLPVLCSLSVMGLPLPALNSGLLGFIYGKTPDEMQGRASAVFETAVGLLGAFTPALTGVILQLRHGFSILMAAALVLALAALATALFSPLRTIPRPDSWDEAEL